MNEANAYEQALLDIALVAEKAMARAEYGGDIHAIHTVELKAIETMWHIARGIIGFAMHEGEGDDEEISHD